MSKIVSSIPGVRYTADVAYQLEPNLLIQGSLKYVAGRRELIARTLFVHLDRNEKGEMDVTGIAVSASRKSDGNSAFYRTDDFDMNPVIQEAVDRVREMVNQDCAKLVD